MIIIHYTFKTVDYTANAGSRGDEAVGVGSRSDEIIA